MTAASGWRNGHRRKNRDSRRDGTENLQEKEMEGRYCMIRNEGGFKITHIEKE